MTILTERLKLRPFCNNDKQWYYNLTQNEEFKARLPGLLAEDYNMAANDVEIFKKADFINDFYFVIEDKKQNIVGIIVAVSMSNLVIDVSYFLEKGYRRCGYMTEALKSFIKTVKDKNRECLFEFQIAKDNFESLNVVKRLGASIDLIDKEYNSYICYV